MATVRQRQQQMGFTPGIQAPRPVAPAAPKLPSPAATGMSLRDMAAASKQQKEEEDKPPAGGLLGRGLGMVLNNPIVNTALRPLDVLDVPRRAVWSTAKELADQFVGGDDNYAGGFSPQDWYDQINPFHAITQKGDVTIGAGTVIPDTGNKWLDRGIGLAGDIIGDPLTYVSGVGFLADAGTSAGKAGRALAITKAADRSREGGRIAPEVLEELQRIGQRGYHEASPEMLSKMDVSGGIRFGIPFTGIQTKGVLPGVSQQTSKLRAGTRDVADRVGLRGSERKLFEAGSPKEIEQAYQRIFRGDGPLDMETAIENVATDMARRRGQGKMAGTFGRRVDELVEEARKLSDEEKRAAINAIETDGVVATGFGGKVQKLLNEMWTEANKAGLKLNRRENYSPHVLTRDAIQWLRSSGDNVDAQKLRGLVTEDLFAPSGVTMSRKFNPGETIILGDQAVKLDGATIDELNAAFKQATGNKFNLYETDPADILQSYINMLSSDVGTAAAAKSRTEAGARMIQANPRDEGMRPIISGQEVDGVETTVSNLGPQQIRPEYVPGQNASRVSEPLPEGVAGPIPYGQTDLDVIGQRAGTELDPELFKVTRDREATELANAGITGSLVEQQQRLASVGEPMLADLEATIAALPATSMERVGAWNDLLKKMRSTKKKLLSDRDRMVRQDGGWVLESQARTQRLQGERAARVGQLDKQAARAAELEQQIANIEAGVALHDRVIQDIMRDIDVMDSAAERSARSRLTEHVSGLQAERDDLFTELERIKARQDAIPKPWQDDPELLARKESLATEVADERRAQAAIEKLHNETASVPLRQADVERLKAQLATWKSNYPTTNPAGRRNIEGKIAKAEERLAQAKAKAQRLIDNDPAYKLSKERLAQAERRAAGPSVEGKARAFEQSLDPMATRTPNVAPTQSASGVTVRGIPLTSIGDASNPAVRSALGMSGDVMQPSVRKEVAEATRRHIGDVTDPGEAANVRRGITLGREDAKSVIRQDTAAATAAIERINDIGRALETVITDQATRDNLRELFRNQFMAGPQGPARQQAEDAFDGLMSQQMQRATTVEAQQQIQDLQSQVERLRSDVNTMAETVTPVTGSTEALLARQAEQGAGYNRAVLNLPGQERGRNATQGQRTLAEIDDAIAAERQATMDAMDTTGQAIGDQEAKIARGEEGLKGANAEARAAHEVQRQAEQVVEKIKDPTLKVEAGVYSDELAQIAADASGPFDNSTAALLNKAVDQTAALEKNKLSEANVNQMIRDGRDGKLTRVVNIELADQWSIMERALLGDDYLIHDDLRKAFQYVREAQYDKNFWPVVDGFTNFFKTYATLSPGFHFRNAMSAAFMNSSDGVPVSDQAEGLSLMRGFTRASKNGTQIEWLEKNGARVLNKETGSTVADAFEAAFGSGIGGRYRERGFADRLTLRAKASEKMFSNKAVNLSKKAGGLVEGSVRLPVALDTLKKGGSLDDAMTRINRLHFDYSQVSKFDEKARKLVPFWTFMSRNLPLQISQMWTKPRVYAWYESFVRNFSGEAEPGTPEYFDEVGAFRFGDTMLGGLPMYLQPDLPHKRIAEDFKRYESALQGNPGQFLTDFNPLFTTPVEFATNQDFFTGRGYDETDLRKTGGLEKPIGWMSQALGLGEETPSGDFATQERFISAMRSLLPMYDRSLRLAPGATSGGNAQDANDRRIESYLRFIGVPVRQLSPAQQEATQRSEFFNNRDDLRMQRTLAELDAGG